ncbi:MAG: ribonuclease HII [Cohaesibacter sp.]|jgi:ribonuclease HII|nr:ribonuclease HII [Cohaesibacter sp.]
MADKKAEQKAASKSKTKQKPKQADLFFTEQDGPDFSLESQAMARFGGLVAGVDEVGRGPLAGPVVTAAVILDPENIPAGLDDSKKLSEAKRTELFKLICTQAHVSVMSASPRQIDALNIRGATLWAMSMALKGLSVPPSYCLFDGRDVPPDSPVRGEPVIKGDGRSVSIAAASIVAKVVRDQMMTQIGLAFPGYGFDKHKGYGTKAHLDALDQLGPCLHHRASFRPISDRL